jgi:hypothetical protein
MKTQRSKIAKLMLGHTTFATAVLALVIALVAAPVMAQETDTVTITGTFTSDTGEHTWSLAMYGSFGQQRRSGPGETTEHAEIIYNGKTA